MYANFSKYLALLPVSTDRVEDDEMRQEYLNQGIIDDNIITHPSTYDSKMIGVEQEGDKNGRYGTRTNGVPVGSKQYVE